MLHGRAQLAQKVKLALLFAVSISIVAASAGFAQSSGSSAPTPQAAQTASQIATAPAITTNVDEVSLDLVAHTKGGKPVRDLSSSDFSVTDDGTPVKLSGLHLVTGTPESERLVTLVFDRLDPGPAKAARDIAAKILKVIPDKGYTFAVLQMNGRLHLLQAYTPNQDLIGKAINEATRMADRGAAATPGSDLTPAEKQLLAAAQDESLSFDVADRSRAKLLLAALEDSQRIVEDEHTFPSLSALQALANSQRHLSGRKYIFYFSQGLYANSDSRDTVSTIIGQANKAGVTICAVDTNALDQQVSDKMQSAAMVGSMNVGGAMQSASSLGFNGAARGSTDPTPGGMISDNAMNMGRLEFDSMDGAKSPLISLAAGTGGVYVRAGAGFKKPLQQLQDDFTTYYEASYVPGIKEYNGQFRPIDIHPLRKDLVIRTRAGYFAVPPDNGSGIRPFEVPLLAVLANPQLPADVPFRSSILHLGQLPAGNTGDLAIEIPVSGLEIRDDASTHLSSVHVTVVAQIKNDKGTVVQRFSEDIPRHEAPDVLRSSSSQVITVQRHFSAEPGEYTLETAVLDRNSNKTGARRAKFTIAPVAHGPALSDIALVRSVEPMHAEAESFEPMRYQNGRIVPDLSGQLPEDTRSLSLFFMVHPVAGSQPQLALQILRNGESLGQMPLELSRTSGMGAVPYLGTIQGHAFPPGSYEVRATLTQDGLTAVSTASFTVEGSATAAAAPAASFTASTGSVPAESAAELAADQRLTSTAAAANSKFSISSPSNPVPPPSDADIHNIIEGARQRALAWSDSLPNFFCVEITDHSVDPSGRGDWKHKDTMIQLMRYVDRRESRTMLELNGQRSSIEPANVDFAHSVGEFGGMFQVVFDPSAKAKFAWKESDVLDGQPVQVFTFQVDRRDSNFDLAGLNNRQLPVGFHGLLYLDAATRSIRRISLDADDIPGSLSVRASSISVDYSWVSINGHDYLLPVRGAISLREGRRQAILNEFEFRNYRRFGSQIRILSGEESKSLSKN